MDSNRIRVFSNTSIESLMAAALLQYGCSSEVNIVYDAEPSDVESFFQSMEFTHYDGVLLIGDALDDVAYSAIADCYADNSTKVLVLTDEVAKSYEDQQIPVMVCDNRDLPHKRPETFGYFQTVMMLLEQSQLPAESWFQAEHGNLIQVVKILDGVSRKNLRLLTAIYESFDPTSFVAFVCDRLRSLYKGSGFFDVITEVSAERILSYQNMLNRSAIKSACKVQGMVWCTFVSEDISLFYDLTAAYPGEGKFLITIVSSRKSYLLSTFNIKDSTHITINRKDLWISEMVLPRPGINTTGSKSESKDSTV